MALFLFVMPVSSCLHLQNTKAPSLKNITYIKVPIILHLQPEMKFDRKIRKWFRESNKVLKKGKLFLDIDDIKYDAPITLYDMNNEKHYKSLYKNIL